MARQANVYVTLPGSLDGSIAPQSLPLPITIGDPTVPITIPIGNPSIPLQNLAGATSNVFDAIASWMQDQTIDIVWKALAAIGGLMLLYFMPATRKFATYAALCLLFILLVSSTGQSSAQSPSNSTLPLPSQIGTPVPNPLSGAGAGGGTNSGGGGFNWLELLPIIGEIL